jgi:LAO/AO transport system kinase
MPSKKERDDCHQPRPDWVPDEAGPAYATWVMEGITPSGVTPVAKHAPRRRQLSIDDYFEGIQKRDTGILARAITLIESNAPAHQELAQQLLARVLPLTGRSLRVGLTGIPGAGKSTFVEALGSRLCSEGHRLAVLAAFSATRCAWKSFPGITMHSSGLRLRAARSVVWRGKAARPCCSAKRRATTS